jgi:hypothetical protein
MNLFPLIYVISLDVVTHYQFLWYVAHTFLPGRKHMCRITALINPTNYADILSQKVSSTVAYSFSSLT